MYKTFTIMDERIHVGIGKDWRAIDGITSRPFEFLLDEQWFLGPQGNWINRILIKTVFQKPIYEDMDVSEDYPDGIRTVGTVAITVFKLCYMKDNREARRGHGEVEYKVLNITAHMI